jgi:ribulose-5-phosphate 4-epimerase/fuculose-1-phosphate aldolase
MAVLEQELREEICFWGKSMFDRGLTPGSSGNLSARLDDGYLVTPTGSCLGTLLPENLSKLDRDGRHIGGEKPTKDTFLHLATYAARPAAGGVVHLHSTYATALSCLADADPQDALTRLTPYAMMLLGTVPIAPHSPPGSDALGRAAGNAMKKHSAVLLANHGPVVSAASFRSAVFAAEELEEAAHLMFVLHNRPARLLPHDAIEAIPDR